MNESDFCPICSVPLTMGYCDCCGYDVKEIQSKNVEDSENWDSFETPLGEQIDGGNDEYQD